MPSPYSSCRSARIPEGKQRPRYVVDIRFKYCSEYIRKGYSSYDVIVIQTKQERLRNQRRQLKRKLDKVEEKVTEAITYVYRLRKQLRFTKEREEKAISKEFAKLQKLSPKEIGVPLATPKFLLEPKGEPSELDSVFQLPLNSQSKFSLIPDDLFQALPDRKSTRLNSSHSGESRMPSSA